MNRSDHRIINSPDQEPVWEDWGKEVRKIVLGPSPGGDEAKALSLGELPADLAERFPKLTQLYLWQINGLKALPTLPRTLECLDARGCKDLTTLPELPNTLETLDVGGCAALQRLPSQAPPALKRFFFNGCGNLKPHSLASFLELLQGVAIEEVDGSLTPAITSLEVFPKSALRKLVLKDCAKLADVNHAADFPVLEHLNLSGCTALEKLPDLPPRLRFLLLHGAEKLSVFMGQDVGPYDRGSESQDVAKAFLSRKKFGKELAIMPHAKLLLMGDGRVGKTTLAKRLQWGDLEATARSQPGNRDLEPSREEPFTHKVRFWRWETGLSLAENDALALENRARAAGVSLAKTRGGQLEGAVRIWDFGGQEIYHHTHRIFAGEGSIFLLVWRAEPPAIGPSPADDVTPEEWKEWNRQRPLDYWLDYIYSMRPGAKVALVCTNCPNPDQMPSKPDWKTRAPKHARRDLPAFFVDSLDGECGGHAEYQRLASWIREACGREAQRIGILQPRFYRQVSDLLDRWLAENSQARQADGKAEHLLYPWVKWQQSVRAAHQTSHSQGGPALDDDDVTSITNYLHDAGHLFQIRHEQHRAILVDQEWAAGLIYQLLLCGSELRRTVKRNGGWFYGADLEGDPLWKSMEDDLQRKRLLAYMEECRIVTRIAEAQRQREGKDVFLASDKWLLPTYPLVEKEVEQKMRLLREQPGILEREKFEFEDLTLHEFDFRSLQALLARTFGTRAVYFRDGFQALDEGEAPDWCFRVRWLPDKKDPFVGKIDAVLLARRQHLEKLAAEIEELFYADGSPIARREARVKQRGLADDCDLSHGYFRTVRQDGFDVGISSSGADRSEAEMLVGALKSAGFKVNWYRLPECRSDDRERVFTFMSSLSKQPAIVLLLSEGYLRNDPALNWYCAWELADAIRQLGEGNRTAAQTLVVFKEGGSFAFGQFNEIAFKLLKDMARHFHQAYARVDPSDLESFRYYDDFTRHFIAAAKSENWTSFIEARGALGSAIDYNGFHKSSNGEKDISKLILAVETAVGRKQKP